MTLYEAVAGWLHYQRRKHDLAPDYAERYINEMSQHDFLQSLSDALEHAGVMVPDEDYTDILGGDK